VTSNLHLALKELRRLDEERIFGLMRFALTKVTMDNAQARFPK
jgi:hypothetical protein